MTLNLENSQNSNSFVVNFAKNGNGVSDWYKNNSKASKRCWVLTGFTSIDFMIDQFGSEIFEYTDTKVLLGNEPLISKSPAINYMNSRWEYLHRDIQEYYLKRGISIAQSFKLLDCIQRLESGEIEVRILDGFHGKMLMYDHEVILGSSNYSRNGISVQMETNARFSSSSEEYIELQDNIFPRFWEQSKSYNQELITILNSLLRMVSWKEVLAKSIAELLFDENNLTDLSKSIEEISKQTKFWPSQKMALKQAKFILDRFGSLLIADATGSGKTRTGVGVFAIYADMILRQGGFLNFKSVLISPPLVKPKWEKEFEAINALCPVFKTVGMLSNGNANLQGYNFVMIDEAHNFLNSKSNRSEELSSHTAESVVLFTATPINRSIQDLFRLIELLGYENLTDQEQIKFKKLKGIFKKNATALKPSDVDSLKQLLKRFTIRRTKSELKSLIELKPELYQDSNGNNCGYPEHRAMVYSLNETQRDIDIIKEIDVLSNNLLGLPWLNKITMALFENSYPKSVMTKDSVKARLNWQKGLAKFNIMNNIRSSRAAALWHVGGVSSIAGILDSSDFEILSEKFYSIKRTKKELDESGDILRKLKNKLENRVMPIIDSGLIDFLDTVWIDENEYFLAVEREIEIYSKIRDLIIQISENREMAKMQLLKAKWEEKESVIAFDSTIITNVYFEWLLTHKLNVPTDDVIIAVGSSKNMKVLEQAFGLNAINEKKIGLFSDALSEGIDLQGAQNLVLLDLPSVMRLAEQRIGRIDRLNSPFDFVNIYWPKDHDSFTLKSDKRFFDTASNVEVTIGGNISIPSGLDSRNLQSIDVDLYREILNVHTNDPRFELLDAFSAVRSLYLGSSALINEEFIDQMKDVETSIICNVSYVECESQWAFYCIKGMDSRSSSWVLQIKQGNGFQFYTDLDVISANLRNLLGNSNSVKKLSLAQQHDAKRFLLGLQKQKKEMLSVAQKRALRIFTEHIKKLRQEFENNFKLNFMESSKLSESENLRKIAFKKELDIAHDAIMNEELDFVPFATEILKIFKIRVSGLKKIKRTKNKIIGLNDLKAELEINNLEISELKRVNQYAFSKYFLENHISAAIFGVVPSPQ
jgi:superfamily II DNA or RNA helicase